MTSLFLPFPPSANGLFSGKARRFKSDGYKAWLKEAEADLLFQKYTDGLKWKNHKGKVRLSILLKAPDKRQRDCSNYIKAVEDFLVSQGIIAGDDSRYVQSVYVEWKNDMRAGCFVVIEDCE